MSEPLAASGMQIKTEAATKSVNVPFVDLRAQYASLKDDVEEAIKGVLARCDFILGDNVREFEEEFARYCGAKYAVGVASGTEALHLALRSLGMGENDEVILPANTFIATVLAVSYTGATPVLVDIDPGTCNMDPEKIEDALTEKTRAVIPVHLYGMAAPMDEIRYLAKKYKLFIVEDACQAHGALYYGAKDAQKAGSIGDMAAFSFYPGKNLGAYGDGGIITTDNHDLCEKARMLRNYGQTVKYHHALKGFNSRLDTIQAAVLRVKLQHLDKWNGLRERHARKYSELLAGIPEVRTPYFDAGKKWSHVFHLYVIRARRRDDLAAFLKERGVFTGIHYPVPIHLQKAYKDLGCGKGAFPSTEEAAREILSLPMFPELTDGQITHVASSIRDFYKR